MRTYARAWVNPNRKLSSSVDVEGNNNPTWNDKFVFRVDEGFLREDSSSVTIEICTQHWFKDIVVGTVRVLVWNLVPPPGMIRRNHVGMRFIALQVRRPSGRPQGILNIGVALLDGSMRSMPLYAQLCNSAVGYHDLTQDPPAHQLQQDANQNNNNNQAPNVKPILRRTRSERSERVTFDNYSPNSSMVAFPTGKLVGPKDGSIISISESADLFRGMTKKKGKASSVISGAELREKPKQKGKASSVVSDSVYSKVSSFHRTKNKPNNSKGTKEKSDKKPNPNDEGPTNKVVDEKSITKVTPKEKPTIGRRTPKYYNAIWSESEVGPTPSEVAAAERRYPLDNYDNQSSVLDGWSLDESVEGLRSKLERWRMELPPLYDHDRGFSSNGYKSSAKRVRRHSDGGSGLFSCFGNICGYECQCICGKPPGRRSSSSRFASSSVGTSFL